MLIWVLSASLIGGAALAAPLTDTERSQLVQRIQQGDSNSMLEGGKSGDLTLIPALEGFLQARSNAVTESITQMTQAVNTEEERRRVIPPREALMYNEYDTAAENARMALAKLGVSRYLDEIMTELKTPTSSTLFRVKYSTLSPRAYGYRVQVGALKKLAYVKNPSTVKDIAEFLRYAKSPNTTEPSDEVRPPLAVFAAGTLRSIVDNPPPTNDPSVWQQWWEQNKDKYP